MKKYLLAFAFALVANLSAFAQGYTFTTSTSTYADLVAPTALTSTAPWTDSIFVTVPIGFPFTFNGSTYTNLYLDNYGDAYLIDMTLATFAGIYVFDTSLEDRGSTTSASPISYSLTGATGSRILKVEWKNAGFSDGASTDFASAQLWIYEGTNKIEVHYGNSTIANVTNTFSPYSAIASGLAFNIDPNSFAAAGIFLQGSPASPNLITSATNTLNYARVIGIPANGTVYTFSVTGASGVATELENAAVTVYPNPTSDKLHIKGLAVTKEPATVKIFDVLGKTVLQEVLPITNSININNLQNGTYFMEVISGKERIGKNVIKQ